MSSNTFHITSEDVRKAEAQEAKYHGGEIPKDSEVSAMKQLLSEQESKQDQIDRVKANLPLPDDPVPGGSSNISSSADATKTGIGSGAVDVKLGTSEDSQTGERGPATAQSSARVDGEEMKVNTAP